MIRQPMGGRSIIDEKIQHSSGHSSLENIKSSFWNIILKIDSERRHFSLRLKTAKIDVLCLLGDQGNTKVLKM